MLDVINAAVPFAKHVGMEVRKIDAEGALAWLPADDSLLNHVGTQHAGALFSVAESASGAALIGACGELLAISPPLVRDARITYRRAAKGEITAEARLAEPGTNYAEIFRREGRVDLTIEVMLRDSAGDDIAEARFEWSFRPLAGGSTKARSVDAEGLQKP